MRGEPYVVRLMLGLRRPKQTVRGADVAGIVEAVGENVTGIQPGDAVFGTAAGTFAEYARGRKNLVPKPERLSFEQAAAIPIAGVTALQALRDKGQLQPGQRVLINGAAGGVGTFAVQIARAFGAEVTGVCSTGNVEMVRSIGADHVVDYTRDDFVRSGARYDLILDNIGNRSLQELGRVMTPEGKLVLVGGGGEGKLFGALTRTIKAPITARLIGRRIISFLANIRREDLMTLKELVDAGKLTPVVDRTYPLRETPEAIRYLETGHARGKVVITA
jgi:NADPH:quinone reductase-like Zn-dependent oxidoreductase